MTIKCFFKANRYEDSLSIHLWNDDRGAIGIYRLEGRLSDLLTGKSAFDPMTAAAVNHDGDRVEGVMGAMQEDLARDSFPDYADRVAKEGIAETAFNQKNLDTIRQGGNSRAHVIDVGENAQAGARWVAIRELHNHRSGVQVPVVFTDEGKAVEFTGISLQPDLTEMAAAYDRAAEKEGRGLCEKFGYEYDAAAGNLRRLFQLKEAVASIPMTAKHIVKQTNEIAARHVQSLTDDHAPAPPVDPERGERVAALFSGIRSLLADSNLAYPGYDDDGPGSSHHEIREWLEGAVKDELEDHETPLTPDERAAISELTEGIIEFDREQRVLIESFDRQAEAEGFNL